MAAAKSEKNRKKRKKVLPKSEAAHITVGVRRLDHALDMPLPGYQSKGAAGLDLHAACAHNAPITLPPKKRCLVPTGLELELPIGFEAQVRPRSGLALKHGITVLNSPGTIDADYRGEVGVILVNLGDETFEIQRGDRIAQMIVAPVSRAELVEKLELTPSERGSGGFGSTGQTQPSENSAQSSRKKKKKKPKAKRKSSKKG